MDIWSKEKRSEVMSKIRSKDTRPEKLLRSALFSLGYRYRLHDKNLPGKPDIIFRKQKIAIFVHGCFWHFHNDCPEGRVPNTNSKFWKEKLEKNIERDKRNIEHLQSEGWKTIVIWECEVEKQLKITTEKIVKILNQQNSSVKR
ncbi:MAG: DNA mismatch endonuclease Vsr [Bacteroidetes bacterium]|nr:DNA mismatch endonuclease Vsr [Bacteroidota bacterium]